jgi:predicted O-methyltransferase YrrM
MSVLLHLVRWTVGLADAEVWTTEAERGCLARHAAGKRKLVEVGVWHAGTSKTLRAAMAPDGVLYAVDPYEPGRLGFSIPRVVGRSELDRVPNGRVVWIRATGADAATSAEIRSAAPFDFVFIDAAQTYETLRSEWQAWCPLVEAAGILALHDSLQMAGDTSAEQTSVRYAREVVSRDPRFELIDAIDTLSVLKRR